MNFVSGVHKELSGSPGIQEIREHIGAAALRKLSPLGKIPAIVMGDFLLSESLAIVSYLSDRFGCHAYYPKQLEKRAKVDQYLHVHDTFTRQATAALRPFVRGAWGAGVPEEDFAKTRRQGRLDTHAVAKVISEEFLTDGHEYLVGMDHVTVADIACYEELRQLEWAGLTDFREFQRLREWFCAMEKLPYHDEAHRFGLALGDICHDAITMPRYVSANLDCHDAMRKAGVQVSSLEWFEPPN